MTKGQLDIEANRTAIKYPANVQFLRVLWALGGLLFRLLPRPLHGPRCLLLRLFGAKVGRRVNISNTAVVYFPWNLEIGDWSAVGDHAIIYNLGQITIGRQTTISQYAHLCAGSHDFRNSSMPLLKTPITVGEQVWVCAEAFVGPNVAIGDGVVVGACAVVNRDVEPWIIVAGNPAEKVGRRELDKEAAQ